MGVLKPNKITLHFLSVFCFLLFCFLCFILNHVWFVFLSLFDCSFVRPPVRPFASVSFSLRSGFCSKLLPRMSHNWNK